MGSARTVLSTTEKPWTSTRRSVRKNIKERSSMKRTTKRKRKTKRQKMIQNDLNVRVRQIKKQSSAQIF